MYASSINWIPIGAIPPYVSVIATSNTEVLGNDKFNIYANVYTKVCTFSESIISELLKFPVLVESLHSFDENDKADEVRHKPT